MSAHGRLHGASLRSTLEWRRFVAAGVLLAVDWFAVLACLTLAWGLRNGPIAAVWPDLSPLYPFEQYLGGLYLLSPWILTFAEAGLYVRRVVYWDEVRQVVRACTVAALIAVFLSAAERPDEEMSRVVIVLTWLATLLVVPIARYNTKLLLVRNGIWRRNVLILGAGETGERVCESIRARPALGYQPVAFLDDDATKIGGMHGGLPVLGPLGDVETATREYLVKDVVVAMPRLSRERLLHVIANCEGYVENIRVVPDMLGSATIGVETQDLDGLLLLHIRWNLAKPWNIALKRCFDVAVASATLLVLAPLLVLIVIAIRVDSPGPAILWQERLGHRWTRFRCAKFRSMHLDNEQRLSKYLAANPAARAEWEEFAKLKSFDPRVTRVGHILRRFSLDELPQLWNVLRGDMSMVGPRPYLPREIETMGDFAETILKAAPGITGLWQVSGRNELPFDQRLRLDEFYVRNWSLWMDLMVLAKTGGVVLRARGAY